MVKFILLFSFTLAYYSFLFYFNRRSRLKFVNANNNFLGKSAAPTFDSSDIEEAQKKESVQIDPLEENKAEILEQPPTSSSQEHQGESTTKTKIENPIEHSLEVEGQVTTVSPEDLEDVKESAEALTKGMLIRDAEEMDSTQPSSMSKISTKVFISELDKLEDSTKITEGSLVFMLQQLSNRKTA